MAKIIHQIWIGPQIPPSLDALRSTWMDAHPDWEYALWDEESLALLPNPYGVTYDRVASVVAPDAVEQVLSDFYRYAILYTYGGIYADVDTRVIRPLDDLLLTPAVMGWEIQDEWIGTSVIYAEQGHDLALTAMGVLGENLRTQQTLTTGTRLAGPQALTPHLLRVPGLKILDEQVLYPVRWDAPLEADLPDRMFPKSYVVHGWQHQRSLRGLPSFG